MINLLISKPTINIIIIFENMIRNLINFIKIRMSGKPFLNESIDIMNNCRLSGCIVLALN
jgi:hypothetical protein